MSEEVDKPVKYSMDEIAKCFDEHHPNCPNKLRRGVIDSAYHFANEIPTKAYEIIETVTIDKITCRGFGASQAISNLLKGWGECLKK